MASRRVDNRSYFLQKRGLTSFEFLVAQVHHDETIDRNSTAVDGGGNYGLAAIDPTRLPFDKNCRRVYPNTYVRVNNIFEVRGWRSVNN